MDMSPHFFWLLATVYPSSMAVAHRKSRRGQGSKKRAAIAALCLIFPVD